LVEFRTRFRVEPDDQVLRGAQLVVGAAEQLFDLCEIVGGEQVEMLAH